MPDHIDSPTPYDALDLANAPLMADNVDTVILGAPIYHGDPAIPGADAAMIPYADAPMISSPDFFMCKGVPKYTPKRHKLIPLHLAVQ